MIMICTQDGNCKAFFKEDQVIPVSYDFDFAGFVNAEYAQPPMFRLHRIQDHIYLGPAFTKEEWKSITKEWLGKNLDNINELFEKEEIYRRKSMTCENMSDFFSAIWPNNHHHWKRTMFTFW